MRARALLYLVQPSPRQGKRPLPVLLRSHHPRVFSWRVCVVRKGRCGAHFYLCAPHPLRPVCGLPGCLVLTVCCTVGQAGTLPRRCTTCDINGGSAALFYIQHCSACGPFSFVPAVFGVLCSDFFFFFFFLFIRRSNGLFCLLWKTAASFLLRLAVVTCSRPATAFPSKAPSFICSSSFHCSHHCAVFLHWLVVCNMVSRMPPSHAATAHRCVCVYNQLTGEGGGVHLLAWFGVKGSAPLCSPARSFHLPLPPLKTCMEHVLKSCRLFGSQASLITEFFLHTPGWGISCFGDNLSRLPCAKRQRRSKTCLCNAVKCGSSLVWCIHCHPCKAVNCG